MHIFFSCLSLNALVPPSSSTDVIFKKQPRNQRASYERSARQGTLKQDYPDVWKATKGARNRCKKTITARECKDMGYCSEEEDLEEYADAAAY